MTNHKGDTMTTTHTDPSYREDFRMIRNHPAISYWLKDALAALDQRDPVDALQDAEILLALAEKRLFEIHNSNLI